VAARRWVLGSISLLAIVLVGVGLWWRRAARSRSLPCPSWLGWLLENPYTEAVAGSKLTLDRARVNPGMVVLDIGSGVGRLTIPAAERVGERGRVVALDMQSSMLREVEKRAAERGLKNVSTELGGIGRRSLGAGVFDRALLVTVLGEIPKQEREPALRGVLESLKPGGVLSVTEIFLDPHYQSRATIRRLADCVGFQVESEHGSWLAFTLNLARSQSAEDRFARQDA